MYQGSSSGPLLIYEDSFRISAHTVEVTLQAGRWRSDAWRRGGRGLGEEAGAVERRGGRGCGEERRQGMWRGEEAGDVERRQGLWRG